MTADPQYRELLAAGERLLAAMQDEGECRALYSREPTPETLARWVKARNAMETQAKSYREAKLYARFRVEPTPTICAEPARS